MSEDDTKVPLPNLEAGDAPVESPPTVLPDNSRSRSHASCSSTRRAEIYLASRRTSGWGGDRNHSADRSSSS